MADGQVILAPTVCLDCETPEEDPWTRPPKDPRQAMDRVGINLREHGALILEGLMEPEADDRTGFAEVAGKLFTWGVQVHELGPYATVDSIGLTGPTGTGKTQLAASTVRHLLGLGYPAHRIVFDRARALINTIQDTYGSGGVDAVIDSRRHAGLWVLDDIGTEKPTADAFRILEDILDRRQGWPTLWTTNYTGEELAERWASQAGHDRFRSRLARFRFLTLTGEDRRFSSG